MRPIICTLTILVGTSILPAAEVDDLVRESQTARKKGDLTAALAAANKAIAADPKSAAAVFVRGEAYAAQRKSAEAIKDFDAALALDKTFLIAVDRRGGEKFKLGQIDESIADFNTFLKAYPNEEPGHWRRGISFYYAGKYAEGAKQFYDGRVEFGADVENAFWHFLCNVRKDGVDKARKELLALDGPDKRVTMMKTYEMIQGKAKPADVIKTAEAGKLDDEDRTEARFYANLYVALYHDALGETDKCKEHMAAAVEQYKIGHYMWDVANVHLARMKKK